MNPDANVKKVVVGMSGGVDSSVAAGILKEEGYDVTGVMLRLWVDDEFDAENRCCTPDAVSTAKAVARKLGIPFYVIDAQDEFRAAVVDYFLKGHRKGETPNPCVVCNKLIRWGFLQKKAELMGADFFATGHYARIEQSGGGFFLKKGSDPKKDQSYVLSRLNQEDLSKTLLPLGVWDKARTRKKAEEIGLFISQKPDSQDLCFTGKGVVPFLQKYAPEAFLPGEIIDPEGNVIGSHRGLSLYTIGQRKGIRLAREHPLYVAGKNIGKNQLIVDYLDALGTNEFKIVDTNWIVENISNDLDAEVMVRYRSALYPARIKKDQSDATATIHTETPIPNVAPGQLAVIYQDDVVIGSGFISNQYFEG